MTDFESIPGPSDDEMLLLTAEEYLDSIGKEDTAESIKRREDNASYALQREIDEQELLIRELVARWEANPSEELDVAIEDAKRALGKMLVDKLNLPPA